MLSSDTEARSGSVDQRFLLQQYQQRVNNGKSPGLLAEDDSRFQGWLRESKSHSRSKSNGKDQ